MYAPLDGDGSQKLTDEELVGRVQRGDVEARTRLVRRHADPLFRYCLTLTDTREDAEDICQETLTRAVGPRPTQWLSCPVTVLALQIVASRLGGVHGVPGTALFLHWPHRRLPERRRPAPRPSQPRRQWLHLWAEDPRIPPPAVGMAATTVLRLAAGRQRV